jgi:flagellar biosynthetic protein FliP
VLAVAPSLVIMVTSFTRMIVTLSIARNAVGMQTVPPNQVITGLALFLTLFVMAPVITEINDVAWQPYLKGELTQSQALHAAEVPMKTFLLENTRREELNLMVKLSGSEKPEDPEDLSLFTIIPAFVLSELKAAFIIGVVILLPFLVIDLVVSSGLMSLGMMMVPPVFVSLPFKLLLFVMANGWSLIAEALVANYR